MGPRVRRTRRSRGHARACRQGRPALALAACGDYIVRAYHLSDGAAVAAGCLPPAAPCAAFAGHYGAVTGLVLLGAPPPPPRSSSATGGYVVSGAWDGCLAVWELEADYGGVDGVEPAPAPPRTLVRAAHAGAVLSVAAAGSSSEGGAGAALWRVASAGADHAVRVWGLASTGRRRGGLKLLWEASAARDGAGASAAAGAGGSAVGALAWGTHSCARLLFSGSWDHAVGALI